MCGRYTYYSASEILEQYNLNLVDDVQSKLAFDFPDNYNVAPGQEMPVIVRGAQEHKIEYMTWGIVPAWSKTAESKLKLINARREGLLEKPMWKRLVGTKRCIVPARGFYEWKTIVGKKYPYYITPVVGSVLSFAGLWDYWTDGVGNDLYTFTIITTTPNKEMAEIHERMPVILDKSKMDMWLEPGELTQGQLDDLLAPAPDGTLLLQRVSTEVNNTRNNKKELIYPLEED